MRKRRHIKFGLYIGIAYSIIYLFNKEGKEINTNDFLNAVIIIFFTLIGAVLPLGN